MQMKKILFMLSLIFSYNTSFANEVAFKESGEKIILSEDGTWSLADDGMFVGESKFLSKDKSFSVEIDTNKWNYITDKQNSDSEFEFKYKNNDAYALFIIEKIPFSMDAIKTSALENFERIGENLEIVKEYKKKVKGQEFLVMEVSFEYMGTKLYYYNCYATGNFGSIQALAYTSDSIYKSVQKDFEELMDTININQVS